MLFTFASNNPSFSHVAVEAPTESDARRLAMVELYGTAPSVSCPDGPREGQGLVVVKRGA